MSENWTPEQETFLAHTGGKMLGVAVAGGGKTTVLIEYIARLIGRGVDPERILMTTFSKRGALDMRDRGAECGVPASVSFRTLHSVGFEMVRYALSRGERKMTVPKDWQLNRVIKDYLEEAPWSGEEVKPRDVMAEIGLAQASLIWPGEDGAWTAADGTRFSAYREWATARGLDDELAALIDAAYVRLEAACKAPERFLDRTKGRPRWITFDQMLSVSARAILRQERKDRWVRAFRNKFDWGLVDEVQDNNLAQWTLVKFLSPENIVAVGDDQQSIFAFRGAQPFLMREFLSEGAKLVPLSANYRSGQSILDVANIILEREIANSDARLYEGRLTAGFADRVSRVESAEYQDSGDEGEMIANDISEMIDGGTDPESIAVLYRINASSGPVEMSLIRRGIRYRVAGSSFFRQKVVKAAIGYIAVAIDENSEAGWKDCYALPLRGIGKQFLASFPTARSARSMGRARRNWVRGARKALEVVDGVQERLSGATLADALDYIFEDCGLREFCRDDDAGANDETEVDEACKALIEACSHLESASDLVRYAQEMTGVAYEDHAQDAGPSVPMVTLSTVHKAKGLQWGSVFMAGVSEELFPFKRGCPAEERRLAYVAITRPKFFLRVSWTAEKGPSWVAQSVADYVAARDALPARQERRGRITEVTNRYIDGEITEEERNAQIAAINGECASCRKSPPIPGAEICYACKAKGEAA
jgi:DNA helicase-2/ATP-dependent DNA helicase PcrA